MELNEKDKKYIQSLKRSNKILLFLSPVLLILAISWTLFVNTRIDKLGIIAKEKNFKSRVTSIKPTTRLEAKLKKVILGNLEDFSDTDDLLRKMVVLFGFSGFILIAIYSFTNYLFSKRILLIIEKLQSK